MFEARNAEVEYEIPTACDRRIFCEDVGIRVKGRLTTIELNEETSDTVDKRDNQIVGSEPKGTRLTNK